VFPAVDDGYHQKFGSGVVWRWRNVCWETQLLKYTV
jgi:hypothetical protein